MTRILVKDFQLENPIYKGASASIYTVVNGLVTSTLATLYADSIGSETLANPQLLDSRGKQKQPIYVDEAVIARISGGGFAPHSTGIISDPSTIANLLIFDSLAALKDADVPYGAMTAMVRGYASAGDGGGGFYYWSSASVAADNGGTIIELNTGGTGRFIKLF